MPVLKCSNGKYRIGTGDCMYKTKAAADKAYAAYLAVTHIVSQAKNVIRASLADDTTAADAAVRQAAGVLRRVRNLRKKKKVKPTKDLPFAGSKLRSKGAGQGMAIGKGAGPIGRMK